MSSFRAAIVELVSVPLGLRPRRALPTGCPTAAVVRATSEPRGPEQNRSRKQIFALAILPPFLRFSRRCVPNAVEHYISLIYVSLGSQFFEISSM